ncbi:TlpA family protein disulfide reductase [Azospira restricta]|uniref:TlpA family protein disulfide reductase n=2 Tax=Azospira restricta TaxID=404405 RepID=A0A974Y5R5_9RHOO|nr:TlpA family protein disulfide reductase [Azospira restricta]
MKPVWALAVPAGVAAVMAAGYYGYGRAAAGDGAGDGGGGSRPLPEIRFQDGSGKPRAMADFRGRVVLLNLWATWCVPCRKENPSLDRLQARLGGPAWMGRSEFVPFADIRTCDERSLHVGQQRRGFRESSTNREPLGRWRRHDAHPQVA